MLELKPATSWMRRISLALLIVLGTFGLAVFTERFLPGNQLMLVLLSGAVATALISGVLLGNIAALLLALGHIYYFQIPKREFSVPSQAELFEVIFFVASALFVGWISSALRAAYEAAELAKHAADESSQAREDLLAIVSHDLKNPLSAIQLNAQLLAKSTTIMETPELIQSTMIINRSAVRALSLIRDLLDIEKIKHGRLSVDLEKCSIPTLVQELSGMMAQTILNKEQQLVIYRPDREIVLSCDSKRLLQALLNLVDNASKFTAEGGKIELGWNRNGDEVEFFIRDSGPGIPNEQLTHLFERYWQAKQTARQGTGLGLSISKGIIEAHGGRIWVESVIGQGSVFRFTLPLKHGDRND